jgi:hypothetical protein
MGKSRIKSKISVLCNTEQSATEQNKKNMKMYDDAYKPKIVLFETIDRFLRGTPTLRKCEKKNQHVKHSFCVKYFIKFQNLTDVFYSSY